MIFENNDRIVFAGDSVTDMGSACPVGEGLFDNLGHSYVRLIDDLLAAVYPERKIRVTNSGVGGNTTRDLESATFVCGEKSIRLSSREFELMRMLMVTGKNHISKESLLVKVWGYDSNAVENHVEVYIGFLRKKLLSIDSDIQIIAVRRLGYHLESESSC